MVNFGKTYDKFYVALGTPLKDDAYTVDYDAFRTFVHNYLQNEDFCEIGGIIVLPEAGEIFTMSREEKDTLIQIAVEEGKGKVPVFAGCIGITTREQVEDAVRAKELGVDGIFVMPPMGTMDITIGWDKYRFPEVYGNVALAVAEATELPQITHAAGPFDMVNGAGMSDQMIIDLAKKDPYIVAWKMLNTYEGIVRNGLKMRAYEEESGHHVGVFAAAGYNHFELMMNNLCDGCVSCFWNYAQELNTSLVKMWKAGDYAGMIKLWTEGGLYNLHKAVGDNNRLHTLFKAATWLRGLIPNPYVRAPMIQVTKEEVLRLRDALTKAGYEVIPEADMEVVMNNLPR